jgi:hypothetical protein
MAQDVSQYVKSCIPCQRNNQKELKNALPRPVIPRGPFDVVAMDCLQLPESIHGNAWILVAVDYFTKYANTYVLRGNPSAENILRCLILYIGQHSLVREFRLDGGMEFANLAMQDACEKLGIEISYVPTGHHRANGLVERLNRTLQNSLCKVLDETVHYEYWEEYATWVTFSYNTSFHEGIQDTPFFMVHGRHAILPADSWMFVRDSNTAPLMEIDVETYKKNMMTRFRETYSRARNCLQEHYKALNIEADKWKQIKFDVGEEVWVYLPEMQQDKEIRAVAKLTYQWRGPMQIAERHPTSEVLYLVLTDRKIKYEQYVHVNRLRKYVSRENKPTDQVLDVPTYDFNWDEIPMPSKLTQAVQQDLMKNQEIEVQELVDQDSGMNESETFEIVQHS